MNVGFFGIQYSFGLQQSAVNPIYDFLGAQPDQIPILNLAGPLTGLLIQPIIGALSDKTWHPKYGRRKPYFFIGAIMCSLALFMFPYSSALWMAVGLLWILDVGNNTAMEPYRAFVADKLNTSQQATGFQAQSFFTGFGQTLANLSLLLFPLVFIGKTGKIPNWVFASFTLGAICSIASVWWSMHTTNEIPPTNEELEEIKKYNVGKPNPVLQILGVLVTITCVPLLFWASASEIINPQLVLLLIIPVSVIWVYCLYKLIKNYAHITFVKTLSDVLSPFIEVVETVSDMPKVMWLLALVYLFQWYALFCYWQNSGKAVAKNIYGWQTFTHSPQLDSTYESYLTFEKGIKTYAERNNLKVNKILTESATPSSLYAAYNNKVNGSTFVPNRMDSLDIISTNNKKLEKASSETGGINAWYNVVTFLVAFLLVGFARKYSPKYVHFVCLLLGGLGFVWFSQIHLLSLFYVAITGFGIGWASMMGIPYLMVVTDIPKEKYGVYMGIINMMIVVPMLLQTLTFGYLMKHIFDNDSTKAILFAGVLLLIAAAATLLIKSNKQPLNN